MKKRIIGINILVGLFLISSQIMFMSESKAAGQKLVLPVLKNPIVSTSNAIGLSVTSIQVQDNTDPKTGVAIADRLALKIRNRTKETIKNIEVFYSMTDTVTKATESYYQKLIGFSIPAGATNYFAFDNGKGPGHYPENTFSIYRHSNNEVKVTVEISATGFKPVFATTTKAKGTTENPNG